MTLRGLLSILGACGCAVLGACAESASTSEPSQALEIFSGNSQTAPPRTALPQPIVVRAAEDGGGKSGVPIQFSVLTGDGYLSLSSPIRVISVVTDGNGLAEAPWVLGPASGVASQSVVASIVGSSGFVTFVANAIPGPPVLIFFLVQPSNVGGNALFSPTVSVAIGDINANIVTTVAPTLLTIQDGRAEVMAGGSAMTQAGIATFPDLRVCPNLGSAGNTVVATGPGYTGVTSTSFVVGLGC